MKNKSIRILLSGVAVGLFFGTQAAPAEDTQVPDETVSHDRGIMWKPLHPTVVPQTPALKPNVPVKVPPKNPSKVVVVKKAPPVKAPAKIKSSPPQVAKTKVKPSGAVKDSPPVAAVPVKPVVIPVTQPSAEQPQVVQAAAHLKESGSVITAVLDRPGANPRYRVGDKLVISVAANQDCNLVVFNYDSNGVLTQIFPNDYQTNGFVRTGETVQIGGPDSPFDYQVAGKGGAERIFVYAYPTGSGAPLTIAMNPLSGTPFRSAEVTPEQYRQLVNESKVFFSREVKITPKKTQLTSQGQQSTTPNKIELVFTVER